MSIKAPVCKLCGEAHWSYQAHAGLRSVVSGSGSAVKRLRGRGSKPEATESLNGGETRRSVTRASPQAQGSKPMVRVQGVSPVPKVVVGERGCAVCGRPIPKAGKGPVRKTCSSTCRKALSRRKA